MIVHDEFFEKKPYDFFEKKPWPLPRRKMKVLRYNNIELYTFTGCQYNEGCQPIHPCHLGMLPENKPLIEEATKNGII